MYNHRMKHVLEQRIALLSEEIQALDAERRAMIERDQEIGIRLHQVVGAIYEMQKLIADLDRQASVEVVSELDSSQQAHQSTHPSEGDDQDSHQEQQVETEKNSQQQS